MRLLLGFLVFLAWASFVRYYYVCEIKGLCEPEEEIAARAQTLDLILDDTIVVLEAYEQFAFETNGLAPDLTPDNEAFLDTLAYILDQDSTQNLTIKGFDRPSEQGLTAGIYEDLGTARASAARQLLIQRGIAEARISLDAGRAESDSLMMPLQFRLFTRDDAIPDAYETVQYSFSNMTYSDANFAYNSDVFQPGEAFQFYADSVKTYLDLNPEKALRIVGHCDNVGSDAYNDELGLRRATNTKDYFENLGVAQEIAVESQGKRSPVVPNDTEENRQKNRRVQIIIE